MHLGLTPVLAGLVVGVVVGLTGSGGGALLTPVLILLLHVKAKTAVASDLVATLFMRPVAGALHLRQGTIHWSLVGWLAAGSVPAAFVSGLVSHSLISASQNKSVLEPLVGVALLVSGGAAVGRRLTRPRSAEAESSAGFRVRPVVSVLIGLLGGAVVGFTSVGSGTLMLVALSFTYPMLKPTELVGTDLIQAVPLVGAAALGHLVGGDLTLTLTASVVVGGVPGAAMGAVLSRSVPQMPLGVVVAAVIFGSGLALVGWQWWVVAVPAAVVVLGVLWWLRRRAPSDELAAAGAATSTT